VDLAGVADHDELAAAFHQMKTASANLGDKVQAANLALDIAHRTANDTATHHGLGAENLIQPGRGEIFQEWVGVHHGARLHVSRKGRVNRNQICCAQEFSAKILGVRSVASDRACQNPGKGRGLTPAARLARI
jgi:uncharacterized protein (UPF0264 family)